MLNARICRRSKDNIILLWDVSKVSEQDRKKAKVYIGGKQLKIRIASSIEEVLGEKFPVADNTEVCLINHEENELDPAKEYDLTIEVGPYTQDLKVHPYGVLAEVEKDEKKKRVQLMAWNEKRKRWQKLTGVETPEGFALLVKISK